MPSTRPSPPLLIIPGADLPSALVEELRAAVRGPVCSRSTAEYVGNIVDDLSVTYSYVRFGERAKTFNGKITCLSNALVSPLDAQDVSAVVLFCRKHGLSPSVKAGGYATAGWSIAGNIIIDLSMMRECDIEPPVEDAEGGKDWTPLASMPPPGSKGKGRARQPIDSIVDSPVPVETSTLPADEAKESVMAGVKRRREDSTEPDARPLPKLSASQEKRNLLRSYDTACDSVAAFFRGPPLPEEGEEPRKPPANRRRYTSPERSSDRPNVQVQTATPSTPASHTEALRVAPLLSISRSSSGSVTVPSEAGTHLTTPDTDEKPSLSASAPPQGADDPFGYLALDGPSSGMTQRSTLTTVNPFGAAAGPCSSTMSMPGFSGMGIGMGNWSAFSASSSLGSQGASSAGVGPRIFPPSFGLPMGIGMGMGTLPFALPMGMLPQEGSLDTVAPAKPVHPYAYVTLGAGMRQKEVDMYTAEHPLEGFSSVTGTRQERVVPYHMPSCVRCL